MIIEYTIINDVTGTGFTDFEIVMVQSVFS